MKKHCKINIKKTTKKYYFSVFNVHIQKCDKKFEGLKRMNLLKLTNSAKRDKSRQVNELETSINIFKFLRYFSLRQSKRNKLSN